jgi:hypothetical protein
LQCSLLPTQHSLERLHSLKQTTNNNRRSNGVDTTHEKYRGNREDWRLRMGDGLGGAALWTKNALYFVFCWAHEMCICWLYLYSASRDFFFGCPTRTIFISLMIDEDEDDSSYV